MGDVVGMRSEGGRNSSLHLLMTDVVGMSINEICSWYEG